MTSKIQILNALKQLLVQHFDDKIKDVILLLCQTCMYVLFFYPCLKNCIYNVPRYSFFFSYLFYILTFATMKNIFSVTFGHLVFG